MSVFKVNAANQLGLDRARSQNALFAVALSKPEEYFRLRANAFEAITVGPVENAYNTYWDLLTSGRTPNGGSLQLNGANFNPGVPDSVAGKFALKVAQAIKDIAEEAIEEILPMKFQDLAVNRSSKMLSSKIV